MPHLLKAMPVLVPRHIHIRRLYLPTLIYPPLVFAGLVITLWAYKCLMMIVFQNQIIYMPSIPPFSRSEKIADYEALCKPVRWREERIKGADGMEVALAVGSMPLEADVTGKGKGRKNVVVLYFQGYGTTLPDELYLQHCSRIISNGSSLPPRLPGLSQVLKSLHTNSLVGNTPKYTIAALSYRGFWTSHGRPSERGINLDAAAALAWASEEFPPDSILVVWGQSLGAGVAVCALAANLEQESTKNKAKTLEIKGLLLETPFTSVRAMLVALYPQKWLPYRYLSPFLWNHWDSIQTLSRISVSHAEPKVLVLPAGDDELVPQAHAMELEVVCKAGQMDVKRTVVKGALHHEVVAKTQGRAAVVEFLKQIGEQA